MIISSSQREHLIGTRIVTWCQGGMLHKNSKDGRYNQSFGKTSWECISDKSKDGIFAGQDKGYW